MIKEEIPPQEKIIFKKGLFLCSYCESDSCEPQNSNAELPMQLNNLIMKILENDQSKFQVVCDIHPDSFVTHFCQQDRQLMCKSRVLEKHSKHFKIVSNVQLETISSFLQNRKGKMQDDIQSIIKTIEEIDEFFTKDKILKSTEFMKLYEDSIRKQI